jgi:hypothetical protein
LYKLRDDNGEEYWSENYDEARAWRSDNDEIGDEGPNEPISKTYTSSSYTPL